VTDSEYLIRLGKAIENLRQKRGVTQSGLALKCDMDRQRMHKIEKGSVNISVLTLQKIAAALEVAPRELLDF
jgi:transcriptional regulator with XRE-family HTH domain